MFLFYYGLSLSYYFYLTVILTLGLSYVYFKTDRKTSKYLILTNLFLLFYFLSSYFVTFIFGQLEAKNYMLLLIYNVIIAFVFISFAGFHQKIFKSFKKVHFGSLVLILVIGIVLGMLFFFVREPVPGNIFDLETASLYYSFLLLALVAFMIALSEQLIFSGFFFNIYSEVTSPRHAIVKTSILFVFFHFIKLKFLFDYYTTTFDYLAIVYISFYYVFLFFFMILGLYFYNGRKKSVEGSFVYPLVLHFITDFLLFSFYFLGA